jgi:hypothetical protein
LSLAGKHSSWQNLLTCLAAKHKIEP